ncbi:MAG TPA: cob(I)yrinic acid a,c-diamide adenosyltransferase [Candidatus Paceibacterota bacterium]|nr:cob(I)yrinic acid a,c-diamide adenosyltransferase [Candidatus Paceibacterota bacterium]
MALFTGKGDGGTTKVFDSEERISKASALPETLGTLDELNSYIGFAKVRAKGEHDPSVVVGGAEHTTSAILKEVQEQLFIVQAEVAGADKHVGEEKVQWESNIVNAIEAMLPPITNFTVAGGTELSAILDVARTISRRAERRVVGIEDLGLRALTPHTKAFMNRLSSLLFALARLANEHAGIAREAPSYK